MRAYVLTTPFHAAKMAFHDENAHSLPFLDDVVAAREEDEAVIDDYPSERGPEFLSGR